MEKERLTETASEQEVLGEPSASTGNDILVNALSKLELSDDSAQSTAVPKTNALILLDAAYGLPKEARPRKEKMLAIARQLVNFMSWQMQAGKEGSAPADIHIIDCPDQATEEALTQRMLELWRKAHRGTQFPHNLTFSKQPMEAFGFENPNPPIYLSPDADEALDPAGPAPNAVVVGLLIDRRIQVNRSKDRASTLSLPVARWPLDSIPHVDKNEPLNVDCIMEGYQQWFWNCEDTKQQPTEACFQKAALQSLQNHETRHPGRTRHTASKTESVIFLDIDGVLLPFQGKSFASTCGSIFPNHTLEAFSLILDTLPDTKLVLSSTWRVQDKFRKEIMAAFRSFGYAYGGPLLEVEFMDLTDPEIHSERQHEIYDWLQRNRERTGAWVALDDEELLEGSENAANKKDFQGHVVKTDSHIGLTMQDARDAIELLRAQLKRK